MSLASVLRTKLLSLSGVTALTGTGAAARIRPDRLHATDSVTDANAAVVIEVDQERPSLDIGGTSRRQYADVTLRCRSRSLAVASQLADAVRSGLCAAAWTDGGTEYDATFEDRQSSFAADDDGSDQGFYDVFVNLIVTNPE